MSSNRSTRNCIPRGRGTGGQDAALYSPADMPAVNAVDDSIARSPNGFCQGERGAR